MTKAKAFRLIFLLLVVLCASCGGGTRGTGTEANIIGSLKAELSTKRQVRAISLVANPVSGVLVSVRAFDLNEQAIDSDFDQTDSEGNFALQVDSAANRLEFDFSSPEINDQFILSQTQSGFKKIAIEFVIREKNIELESLNYFFNSDSDEAMNIPELKPSTPVSKPGDSEAQPESPEPQASPAPSPPTDSEQGAPPIDSPQEPPSTEAPNGDQVDQDSPGSNDKPNQNQGGSPGNGDNGANSGKVTVCHLAKKESKTMEIPESALAAHLAHGDSLGACAQEA